MSLLAVKNYIQTVVGGTTIPASVTKWKTVKGYRQMPKETVLGSKAIVVFGDVDGSERRKTFPIGSGAKEVVWKFPLAIHAGATDEGTGGDQFDVLVWAIMNAIRTANTGIPINDPLTNEESILHAIGENIDIKSLTPIQIAPDGEGQASQVKFEATLRVEVKEWLENA